MYVVMEDMQLAGVRQEDAEDRDRGGLFTVVTLEKPT